MASSHQAEVASLTYLFTFTVRDMVAHPESTPRLSRSGDWRPPRPLNHNVLSDDAPQADYHNHTSYGYNISRNAIDDLRLDDPTDRYETMQEYRCVSMYYEHGTIWVVNYDATENQIGNGRLANDDDDSTSSDEDGAHEETEYGHFDWERLQFRHVADGSSWVDYAVGQRRLYAQRDDQRWQRRILPDAYLAPQNMIGIRGQEAPYGSLNGNLAILIGLLAMAADGTQAAVHYSLIHVIRRTWRTPQHAHPQGWHDRRGLVITVYAEPVMAPMVIAYEREPLFT